MEHEEAIRLHAAERYVARELSPTEQDAFEDHFFDCAECAEDVRFEVTFAANLRAVLSEPEPQPVPAPQELAKRAWQRWREWLRLHPVMALSYAGNVALAAACAVLLLTGGRQTLQPQFAQVYFEPGPAHGAADVHSLPRGDAFYAVRFPLAPSVSSYSYEILDESGQRQASSSLQAPGATEDTWYLKVPVRNLPDGVHVLVIHAGGVDGEMVSRSQFRTSH